MNLNLATDKSQLSLVNNSILFSAIREKLILLIVNKSFKTVFCTPGLFFAVI